MSWALLCARSHRPNSKSLGRPYGHTSLSRHLVALLAATVVHRPLPPVLPRVVVNDQAAASAGVWVGGNRHLGVGGGDAGLMSRVLQERRAGEMTPLATAADVRVSQSGEPVCAVSCLQVLPVLFDLAEHVLVLVRSQFGLPASDAA